MWLGVLDTESILCKRILPLYFIRGWMSSMANCFEKDFVILEFLPYFSERFSWANKNEFWLLFQCIFNGNTMVLHWNYFSFMEKSLMFSLEKIFQKNMIKILESQNPFRSSLPSSSSNSWCNIKAKFFCKVYYRCPKHLTIYHINLSQIHWFWVEPYWDPSHVNYCNYELYERKLGINFSWT